ncbi:Alpha/Beta hydrolase protein [Crucibulum laeve]|uniref:Alpha/Beta hydrolase protein n=1 Tax=Crucibulum laeve TaxID=68775 RepID=A0A5C3M8U9_9AGAR|nr:Alpha/Beta hydrolase protein [Crucibulum laeve]
MTILLPACLFSRKASVLQPSSPALDPSNHLPIHVLHHYAQPGIPPPSSRVDPNFKLQPRRPLRLWECWKYGLAIAIKATEVTGDVLAHQIWGPRKKSWGLDMTIFTSLARGAGRHSALFDIATIRMFMSIGGLAPLPADALVTPVTFRVRRRQLRGILAEFDNAENGFRELSGEWVVGKKTWHRLQAEWKAANTNTQHGPPPQSPPKTKERVVLYIHGGAYYLSSASAQRLISIPLSKYTDARVFALDYRLAPETRFPGPLHDAVVCYLRLVEDLHIPPENILICGDSAGGGLSLALLMYLRDNDYPLPSGAILLSPWVDLTMSCESWDSNALFDVVPFPAADNHMNPIGLYLGEDAEKYLTHPYVSPLFGDFKGLPPLLIQAGDAEVLRDEIALLAHKATLAGVEVRHELYEDAIHVFQAYPFLDITRRSFEAMSNFVRNILPQMQSCSPQPLDLNTEKQLEEEIESEKAVVVSGDGVEEASQPGMDVTPDVEASANQNDDDPSSWTHSPTWSRFSDSRSRLFSMEDMNEKGFGGIEKLESPPDFYLPSPASSPKATQTPSPPISPRTAPRRIRSITTLSTTPSIRPKPRHHRSSHHLTLDMLSTDTDNNTYPSPPSPSLRRKLASASHSDIASLVRNWSETGPANQTLLYRTQSRS